jgi:hypothetical protein
MPLPACRRRRHPCPDFGARSNHVGQMAALWRGFDTKGNGFGGYNVGAAALIV